jgi:hypothetical protein
MSKSNFSFVSSFHKQRERTALAKVYSAAVFYRFLFLNFGDPQLFPDPDKIKKAVLDDLTNRRDDAKKNHKENCEEYCANCHQYLSSLGQPSGCRCNR